MESIDHLIADLGSHNFELRHKAWKMIEEMGDSAIPYLIQALNNPSKAIRGSAAELLGRTNNLLGVTPLIASLRDPS